MTGVSATMPGIFDNKHGNIRSIRGTSRETSTSALNLPSKRSVCSERWFVFFLRSTYRLDHIIFAYHSTKSFNVCKVCSISAPILFLPVRMLSSCPIILSSSSYWQRDFFLFSSGNLNDGAGIWRRHLPTGAHLRVWVQYGYPTLYATPITNPRLDDFMHARVIL